MFPDVIYKTKMSAPAAIVVPKTIHNLNTMENYLRSKATSLKIYCTCTFGKLKFFEISLHGVIIPLLSHYSAAVTVIKKSHYTFTALENVHSLHISSSSSSSFLCCHPCLPLFLHIYVNTYGSIIHAFIQLP